MRYCRMITNGNLQEVVMTYVKYHSSTCLTEMKNTAQKLESKIKKMQNPCM
jgi:hypothetical protein